MPSFETEETQQSAPEAARARVRAVVLGHVRESPDSGDRCYPGTVLRKAVASHPRAGAALAWLSLRDPDAHLRDRAQELLWMAAKGRIFRGERRRSLFEQAVPVLLQAVRDTSIEDPVKLAAVELLAEMGRPLAPQEYARWFRDLPGARAQREKDLLGRLEDAPVTIQRYLEYERIVGNGTPDRLPAERIEEVLNHMLAVLRHNPPVGAAGLCVSLALLPERGAQADLPFAREVLERVADTRHPRAAWYLQELGRLPGLGVVGEAARDAARELAGAGVSPLAPVTGAFSGGVLSGAGPDGARNFVLFHRTDRGDEDPMSVLFDDEDGVRDAWCSFGGGSRLREAMRDAPPTVRECFCDVALAREHFADALALHGDARRVPGLWLLYRHYLGPEPIRPERRRPNLGAYMLETVVPAPNLADDSGSLLNEPAYGIFIWFTPQARAFVREAYRRQAWRRRAPAAVLDEFLRTVVEPQRERLAARLAANLEVEARGGRAMETQNRMAARTWLVLKEGLRPLGEVPYVRALAERSIELCLADGGKA
jgi:hypothetical protein